MSIDAASKPKDERTVTPNFITDIIDEDLEAGKVQEVVTRFPPEPNGYAHLGHAIASFINFGIAGDYGGLCNLRFDDTNPATERVEFAESLERDFRWLGWNWDDRLFFASDYFEQLYGFALRLIEEGKAYVDSLSEEEIQAYRGTVTEAGRESPYRERSVEENLALFRGMRRGDFPEGAHVLRAKIDMANPNMKMRDPLLYRIRFEKHYRTGSAWPIYPMYDFQHPLSDAIEGVTHSLCSLEFVENRAVYDWLMNNLIGSPRPYQYEFGRRSIEYTVVSKRKLVQLIQEGHVTGWDDPRMPTLAGMRRRGVRPEAIREFASRVGISRTNRTVDIALLEYAVRDDLNTRAPRVMAVLDPVKIVITNYSEGEEEQLEAPYWPHDVPNEGSRQVPFARELYIEREDFSENPPEGFYRLSPGREVRLRYAYVIRCDEVIKDAEGNVTELRCSYDPETLGRNPQGRKVKGTVHWVSAKHTLAAEVRLYDRLFSVPNPEAEEGVFTDYLNPSSLITQRGFVEPSVAGDSPETRYQFERQGYFVQDSVDSGADRLVFNRVVPLRDSWAKQEQEKEEPKARQEPKPKRVQVASALGEPKDPTLEFSPEQKRKLETYIGELRLSHDDAQILVGDLALAGYFEQALKTHNNPQSVANWIVNELLRELKEVSLADLRVTPPQLASLVSFVDEETISKRSAKEVFETMLRTGDNPAEIIGREGLEQVTDKSELEPIVDTLITNNPDKVRAYGDGKTGLMGFFVGQVMRETKGTANPQLVQDLLTSKLAKGD